MWTYPKVFFYFVFFFFFFIFFFKQKTAYEIVDCDWSSDVCSSDLVQEIMTRNVIMASGQASLAAITQQMAAASVSCVVIVQENAGIILPIGIVTERDVVQIGRASCRERV